MIGARTVEAFREHFGAEPDLLIRSPGRVNLIGEHTDYNDGFVLPMAIERALWIALRARPDDTVRIWSGLGDQWAEFSLSALNHSGGWSEYVQGVANELQRTGKELRGWEGAILSDIPTGAGLSSSAALELGGGAGIFGGFAVCLGPGGNGRDLPAGGKRLGRNEVRDHGSADLRRRPSGPGVAHRLPGSHLDAGHGTRRGDGGRARYLHPPRTGWICVQRPGGRLCRSRRALSGSRHCAISTGTPSARDTTGWTRSPSDEPGTWYSRTTGPSPWPAPSIGAT